MLSKREKLFAAVSDLHGLICPVCRQLLSRQGDNLICAGGHAINVNRRGCVNLLSAQADTFYDAALFAARERVFAAGGCPPGGVSRSRTPSTRCCRMRPKSCLTRAAAKAGT